ncbi:unnamed protein product [Rhodiola kirilowii]
MEYPKNFTTTEGCSSSESGWTMYISSPMDMNGQCNYDDEDDYNHNQNTDVGFTCGEHISRVVPDNGADTDDSMASDASSGPVVSRTVSIPKLGKDKKSATQKKENESEKRGGQSSYKKSKKEKLYSKKNCK